MVEITEQRSRRSGHDAIFVAEGNPLNSLPVLARADGVDQFEQGHFPLEADDAVEFRDKLERLAIAEAREMTTYREVARNTVRSQERQQPCVAIDVELEDQGEPDQNRVDLPRHARNRFGLLLDVDHLNGVAVAT